MEGGTGYDTYRSGMGDTIKDVGGKGQIYFDRTYLLGFEDESMSIAFITLVGINRKKYRRLSNEKK